MNAVMRTIAVGSITYAQKARRALAARGLDARLVKITSPREGCVYGVEVKDTQFSTAVALLAELGIYSRDP